MIDRRGFLSEMLAVGICAPYVIQDSSLLMPVRDRRWSYDINLSRGPDGKWSRSEVVIVDEERKLMMPKYRRYNKTDRACTIAVWEGDGSPAWYHWFPEKNPSAYGF